MASQMRELQSIRTHRVGQPDDLFICSVSFEERCVGTCRLFDDYKFDNGFVFVNDQPVENKEQRLREITETTQPLGKVEILPYSETDPAGSIALFTMHLHELGLNPTSSIITLDITTFNKRHLLMLLKELDELGYWSSLRVLYTEPQDYATDLYLPLSMGIKQIDPVPGFVNTQPLNKPLLLLILLGYEGDRAMALFNNIDPNETLLVVPKPAFHDEWEGRTEKMNSDLITLLGDEKLRHADSRNPEEVAATLAKILTSGDHNLDDWSCYVSPLGTKPQIVGLYLFWRQNQNQFSILYAQPLKHNEFFNSTGVGRTWLLVSPN